MKASLIRIKYTTVTVDMLLWVDEEDAIESLNVDVFVGVDEEVFCMSIAQSSPYEKGRYLGIQ